MTAPARLDVVTAVLPARAGHLAHTAASVAAAQRAAASVGWDLRWVVVTDGGRLEGDIDWPAGTTLLTLPAHAGVATARNRGLTSCSTGWVLPLDADDLLDSAGLAGLLADPVLEEVEWAAANRVLLDGTPTPHWIEAPRRWAPGELEEAWTAPFALSGSHPNTALARTELVLTAGGWPALSVNEDLGLALTMSSIAPGASTTAVILRYRAWAEQTVAQPWYPGAKTDSFAFIAASTDARRRRRGKGPIRPPAPGAAHGIQAVTGARRKPVTAAFRLALAGRPALTTIPAGPAQPVADHVIDDLVVRAGDAWRLLHACAHAQLAPALAELIAELELTIRGSEGDLRCRLLGLLAGTYQVAAAMLAKTGDFTAAWVAADRAIRSGDMCGDAGVVTAGQLRLAHVFLASGEGDLARHVAHQALAGLPEPSADTDPALVSLTGACTLALAVVDAQAGNWEEARRHLQVAATLAGQLGTDHNDFGLEFGPTNVAIHQVAVAVELSRPAEALALAAAVDASVLSSERQTRFLADVARAHTQLGASPEAVATLERAEAIAPGELLEGH